ncbi:LCP family protein [Mediterraneibacter agrestimuris]|uniref:LCP family protein n=1 Tax=Mediterraneibacter agrestimuris TaxID=2941333 RepID=UPI00203E186B|nr:LCP family protein [Mediterraneibacter agrestimuris]
MKQKKYKIDPENPAKHLNWYSSRKGVVPKSWRRTFLRGCLIFAGILFLVLSGIVGAFVYLRTKGDKNLRTEVPEVTESKTELPEGIYITYQGKQYRYNSDIINFLCLGIDKELAIEEKRETGSEGLADVILLVSINVQSNEFKILAIPRETVVPVKVLDKAGNFVKTENKQITLQYAYGRSAKMSCELMSETVSNLLYKLPVQRYCVINFQALPVLNDAIGGVHLTALETVEWNEGGFYEGQEMYLLGQSALDYVRQRDEYKAGSSMGRLERQKQYVTCYMEQAKAALKTDITLPIQLYQGLTEHMRTNVTVEDIAYLVPEVLEMNLTMDNIMMVPGTTVPAGDTEEYQADTDALKELVIQNFYEEVPDQKKTEETRDPEKIED